MAIDISFTELFSSQSIGFGKEQCTENKRLNTDTLILIVEDDYFVAHVMGGTFSALGVKSVVAEDGTRAISLFEEYKNEVSCVIVDFDIPGAHSSRVVSHIREKKEDVRIVLSSGHNIARIEQCFPMSEIDWFISKPFNAQELLASLNISSAE